jgi:hypothetical protein
VAVLVVTVGHDCGEHSDTSTPTGSEQLLKAG